MSNSGYILGLKVNLWDASKQLVSTKIWWNPVRTEWAIKTLQQGHSSRENRKPFLKVREKKTMNCYGDTTKNWCSSYVPLLTERYHSTASKKKKKKNCSSLAVYMASDAILILTCIFYILWISFKWLLFVKIARE